MDKFQQNDQISARLSHEWTRTTQLRLVRQFLFCNQDTLLMTTRYTIPAARRWDALFIITPSVADVITVVIGEL